MRRVILAALPTAVMAISGTLNASYNNIGGASCSAFDHQFNLVRPRDARNQLSRDH